MKYMEFSEFVKAYELDPKIMRATLKENNKRLFGADENLVREYDVQKYIELYQEYETKHASQIEAYKRQEQYQQNRAQAMPEILITSGFSFDGYKITKYSGYISGDDAASIDRESIFHMGGKLNGQALTDTLAKLRIQALKELKEAAYDLGCNAVIGVDFDYLTLSPESIEHTLTTSMHIYEPYIICVTANGNAVVIEKD